MTPADMTVLRSIAFDEAPAPCRLNDNFKHFFALFKSENKYKLYYMEKLNYVSYEFYITSPVFVWKNVSTKFLIIFSTKVKEFFEDIWRSVDVKYSKTNKRISKIIFLNFFSGLSRSLFWTKIFFQIFKVLKGIRRCFLSFFLWLISMFRDCFVFQRLK